ncbi:SusC/RagA family TonB-linked outer membrane protein [Sphingobacterium griseoflavum]|uniref:SusC/RagA family TonB-linked outer membrane protein n=2 Tax=Sphingobacterium griseoflavum TaxID=1474952 RepID=A0ABQ3HUS7_9SPHI|nr:SusC/RagA family TonB-linked outer membrane protein [Sphingobacterium griseoflavum]
MSDAKGNYSLTITDQNARIVFTSVGFESKEVPVGKATLVQLNAEAGSLEEVVVVGFGTQKKVNLTGAVSHVGKETFENRPIANIGQALQGVVPNLNVDFSNGAPNTTPNFNLRGGTSMERIPNTTEYRSAMGEPLVMIDGVESTTGQLNQINPNDILDMSFIKDASAAAIYGTKAAYGVILVRTKRGEFNQEGRIMYSADANFNTPLALPDILDAYTQQKAGMDFTTWTGGQPNTAAIRKLEMIEKYQQNPTPENAWFLDGNNIVWVGDMNPFREVVRNWTPMQKHTVSTSGGGSNVNYYASLGLQDQEGMFNINTDEFKRYNALINVSARVKEYFNVDFKFAFDQSNYTAPYLVGGKGNLWQAMMGEPNKNINMPIRTGPNDPLPNTYTDNILAWISYGATNRSYDRRLSLVVSPEFNIIQNTLKLRADIGYLPQNYRLNRFSPKITQVVDSWTPTVQQAEAAEHRAYFENANRNMYTANIYFDFKKSIANKHNFSSIVGIFQERVDYQSLNNTFRGLINPNVQNPNAAEDPTLHLVSADSYTLAGRAVFGRLGYNFLERYLIEMNIRYDGHSKFTPRERFVTFPSISAAWRIADENFMKFTSNWLDDLKFRGSYGILGNQPSEAYPYQPQLSSEKSTYLINGQQVTVLNPPSLVHPQLTFEKARSINFGVDAAFLNRKLSATFEWYERTTWDILTTEDALYPSLLGATPPLVNSGELQTRGMELQLQYRNQTQSGIHYSVGVNLSDHLTTVKFFGGNNINLLVRGSNELLYTGKTIGEIWGFETGGILQEHDFESQNPNGSWSFAGPNQTRINPNLFPGYVWYRDINGDGLVDRGTRTLENSGDMRVIGNNTPRYRFAVMGNVRYKSFDLDLMFQGILHRDLWIGNGVVGNNAHNIYWGGGAGSRWMYDRSWTPDNTDAEYPMYMSPIQPQTHYLVNGAYFRLKQAILGYTMNQNITRRIGLDRLRFTLSGYNLFEFTEIPGIFDVEQISAQYPLQRTVAIGAQLAF